MQNNEEDHTSPVKESTKDWVTRSFSKAIQKSPEDKKDKRDADSDTEEKKDERKYIQTETCSGVKGSGYSAKGLVHCKQGRDKSERNGGRTCANR